MLESLEIKKHHYKLIIFDWEGTLAKADGCLFKGIKETLSLLIEHDFKCAIATSMSLNRLENLLDETELQDYFICLQTADSDVVKPDPRMLTNLLDHVFEKAEAALMVGDSVYDLSMASNAHVDAIGVLSGADTKECLALEKPQAILESVNDLPQYLNITLC